MDEISIGLRHDMIQAKKKGSLKAHREMSFINVMQRVMFYLICISPEPNL